MSHVARSAVARSMSIGLASFFLSLVPSAPAGAAVVDASSAAAFRDSIGVATHFDFVGHAYANESVATLKSTLRGVGIRHIRDHACFDTDAVCTVVRSRLTQMADTFGPEGPKVGVMVIAAPLVGAPTKQVDRDAEILRALRGVRDSGLGSMTEGLEMVNEPDYRGGVWAAQTIADAKTFRRLLALPEFESLRSIPVVAPALGKQTKTPDLVKAGWTKDLADVSNMHPYPMPYDTPEATGIASACNTGRTVTDCATDLAESSRALATESGYSTAGTVLISDWVSKQAQATYTLRLLLHNFKMGIPRTYLYELIDLSGRQVDRNHGYGLMGARDTNDGVRIGGPKPVYTALQRLNDEIGDLGAAALPGSIDVTVTDPTTGEEVPQSKVETVVLRRSDGKYVLAAWQPAKAWQHANYSYRDLFTTVKPLRVTLDDSHGGWQATRYTPVTSGDPQESWKDASTFDFGVDGNVTLLELTPPAALLGPVAPVDEQPGTTVPENAIPGTTLTDPVRDPDAVAPADQSGVTAPRTDGPRPGAESRTTGPVVQPQGRDQAAAARERANRLERARTRARRAYAACLRRQVVKAQRRTPAASERPRPSRPTREMRARCGRWLAR